MPCQFSIRNAIILFIGFVSIALSSHSLFADTLSREELLVIGVISSNPQRAYKRTQPFAEYMAANLQQHNITTARVVIAKDVRQMTHWLKNGQVDLVSETVFASQELIQNADAQLLARRWKDDVAEYSTVFFSRLNNGVNSLDDLKGKTVVFEDRGSTSAFLIPAATLLDQGYQLYELTSPREVPPDGKIGYIFSDEFSRSGGETNMMSWVHRNIVAAAAFSNLDWGKEIPDQVRNELQVIYTSQTLPRSLILNRSSMPPELKQDILKLLLNAHLDPEGYKALRAYKKTKMFDSITPEIESSLQWVGEQKTLVGEIFVR
ncbi:phosphate/phosphite/phosphonate ABC transporter substrate-binding protein [Vibrio sp. 10N.261.55.A7]|uniref:phosphate/phosphite/phosphonate ABC transporter substrate-binding protein n=1 Tax=Vibrio sp. 10N.261.55.A7 TaxID=1880851 RepID=UPI000C818BA3|nr:phosphate/phosphite/phosphonate ABC transporter substrate-binding protein [Vibrio sp. 10N.261.55.A7]PMJ96383.1 alkylphosphonate ABC transporter [Vibrio sp. 10N.261.55.A7]